MKYTIVK
ncbi:Protein of unknown function [Bacillus thuringiensis]|nr:Protein of unknown function [Bacillus thuringiensis]